MSEVARPERPARSAAAADSRGVRARSASGTIAIHRIASRSAAALFVGAGVVSLVNSFVTRAPTADVGALRMTALLTLAAALVVPRLPWERHGRAVAFSIVVCVLPFIVVTDFFNHYSTTPAAVAVYPVFFIIIIAWTGLTQRPGLATVAALASGAVLGLMLAHGGHGTTGWQSVIVTVPTAAILGEVVSWAFNRAAALAQLDAARRTALEGLVSGASRLQGALTAEESRRILEQTAVAVFDGHDASFAPGESVIDDGPSLDDARYEQSSGTLQIRLRGQSGVLGTLVVMVDQPDAFLLDAARLFSQHMGSRLEQLRVIAALSDAATVDPLTGVGNRRAAQADMDSLEPGDGVLLIDLDNFKTVNDSLGHQSGDALLAAFGEYLREAMRPTDSVSRYGGEEFLVVSAGAGAEGTARIADRLLDGWRNRRPLATFSIGYTVHVAGDPRELTIEHADMALYQAKRDGRDRACAWSPIETAAGVGEVPSP
jgi:diguanylate cyclase (GGDEF)-like protein